MYLIHTTSLHLRWFSDAETPAYAILSHCWENHEVTFQDVLNDAQRDGPGFEKLLACCELARSHGISWAWIDTCCINKTSSVELSEAINSMFTWYKNSMVCYVFLSDLVPRSQDPLQTAPGQSQKISNCRWFTRSWTLQELLAPPDLIFFNKHLHQIGTRSTLVEHISSITGIGQSYLLKPQSVHEASVARRMSWASRRQASRPEDIAYSLLGLFNVNMPLLYGEGERKAFLRLQEHIISQCADESIFSWTSKTSDRQQRHGLLAESPLGFADCGSVHQVQFPASRPPYTITNRGIQLPIPANPIRGSLFRWMPALTSSVEVDLACEDLSQDVSFKTTARAISIRLRTDNRLANQQCYRADTSEPIFRSRSHQLRSWVSIMLFGYTTVYVTPLRAQQTNPRRHFRQLAIIALASAIVVFTVMAILFSTAIIRNRIVRTGKFGIREATWTWLCLTWASKLFRSSYLFLLLLLVLLIFDVFWGYK